MLNTINLFIKILLICYNIRDMEKKKTIEGFLLVIATYVIWGVFPLFWVLLDHVSPIETIMQRIFWSFVVTGIGLYVFMDYKSFHKKLKQMWKEKTPFIISILCSFLIAINWGTYIYAVVTDRVLDASLGYYINPIVTIALGALFLKEKLIRSQKLAILISFLGVLVVIFYSGKLPWISIVLPLSFATYSLLKKKLDLKPMESLFLECLFLMPIVIPYLIYLHINNSSSFAIDMTGLLLVISGPVTLLPLFLYAAALRRIKLSDVGITQYLSPTIAFSIGYFVLHEEANVSYLVALILIWIGIILYIKSLFAKKEKIE